MSDFLNGFISDEDYPFLNWRQPVKAHAASGFDYRALFSFIDNLLESWSGIVSSPDFNCFLSETCQLLANSLDLMRIGYFDAAFYSVRQAGEVLLSGVVFFDLDHKDGRSRYEKWAELDRFPSFVGLCDLLKKKGRNYAALIEQVPSFSELFREVNAYANKYVHKQGFGSFYHCPMPGDYKNTDKVRSDFERYFKRVIGLCAALRLIIDPFPLLLNDVRCQNRFPDSLTIPFSPRFVSECFDASFINEYRKSDFYLAWVETVIDNFPKLSDSAYLLSNAHVVESNHISDAFGDIRYLQFSDAIALCFIAVAPKKIAAVHMSDVLDSYVNSQLEHSGIWFIDMAGSVEQLGGSNVRFEDVYAHLRSSDTCNLEVIPDNQAWLTAVKSAGRIICVESVCPLCDAEVGLLQELAKEFADFASEFSSRDSTMNEISNLEAIRRLMTKCDRG